MNTNILHVILLGRAQCLNRRDVFQPWSKNVEKSVSVAVTKARPYGKLLALALISLQPLQWCKTPYPTQVKSECAVNLHSLGKQVWHCAEFWSWVLIFTCWPLTPIEGPLASSNPLSVFYENVRLWLLMRRIGEGATGPAGNLTFASGLITLHNSHDLHCALCKLTPSFASLRTCLTQDIYRPNSVFKNIQIYTKPKVWVLRQ